MLYLVLAGLLLFAGIAPAQEHHTFNVPFHMVSGLIVIEARVGGKPVTLVIDTGASITWFRRVPPGDNSIQIEIDPTCDKCSTYLEAKAFDSLGAARNFEIAKYAGNVDGILGENFLSHFHSVRIDYRNRVIEFDR